MDTLGRLITEGKLTEEEVIKAVKALAGANEKTEEEIWKEKHEDLVKKTRERAEENRKNVENIKENIERRKELDKKIEFLSTLKNKLGENVYSLEEISKMSGFEIENLYDLYSNKKDSKEIAQNFETKINENDPLNSKQIPVENDFSILKEKQENENAKNNEVQSVENGLSVLNEKQENEKNNEIKETEENDNIKAIDEAKKQVTSEEPQKVKSIENASPSKIKQVWSKFKNNKKILSVIGIGIAAIAGLLLAGISIEMILSTSSAVLAGYASGYVAKKSGILK